jgi:integrase
MTFIIDKEQIKSGLIIFRRGDVGHDGYYCRVRIQNEDRYKTISLRTSDR